MKRCGLSAFSCLKRSTFGFSGLKRSAFGFTLAELLIALAILGVIATFTIPKVLQSQTDGRYKAAAKEAIAAIAGAYDAYRQQNTPTALTSPVDLNPYLNYVRLETVATIDNYNGIGSQICPSAGLCLVMHNGGIIRTNYNGFGGTATTNAVWFLFDPDGKDSGTTNGPGKAVQFWLYYNGRITTREDLLPNTYNDGYSGGGIVQLNPIAGSNPAWFSWN